MTETTTALDLMTDAVLNHDATRIRMGLQLEDAVRIGDSVMCLGAAHDEDTGTTDGWNWTVYETDENGNLVESGIYGWVATTDEARQVVADWVARATA